MSMETWSCAACKHWIRPFGSRGFLMDSLDHNRWGYCHLAQSEGGDAVHGTLSIAQDVESYRGFLRTVAGFGCVQFEGGDWEPCQACNAEEESDD